MKRLLLLFLCTGIALLYFSCSQNNPSAPDLSQSDNVTNTLAKKPLPTLTGTIVLTFTDANPPYFWNGTITIGTDTYPLRFKSLGVEPPPPPPRAFVFEEEFEISDDGFNTFLLQGSNHGVVPCSKNNTFVANGKVEIANGPFAMWNGRTVHIRGTITWVVPCVFPAGATGTFRIN
jgi:hypothetical protein